MNNVTHPRETCPYKGLQPYTEEDRRYFFGRERDRQIIAANLHAAQTTLLYGTSGVGKSSILMAGVVPDLKSPRAAVVVFRSWHQRDLAGEFKSQVARAVGESLGKDIEIDTSLSLDRFLAQCCRTLRGDIFIIFDQFEEFFIYHPLQDSETFDDQFVRAANNQAVDAHFLLSLREDSLGKLDRFQSRIPDLLHNRIRLEHLDREAALNAIRGPIQEFNQQLGEPDSIQIEPQLVEALIAQTITDGRIETPFLQMVLTRLWTEEMAQRSRTLRLRTLEKLGGSQLIVSNHFDDAMSGLSEAERDVAASVFRFLVTPSGTKIAVESAALASWTELDEAQVTSLLNRLSSPDLRILRVISVPGEPESYEIFHDVLASSILKWQGEYSQQKRIEESKQEERSQAAIQRDRDRVRRQRITLVFLAGLLLVVSTVAAYALQQKHNATTAKNELATKNSELETTKENLVITNHTLTKTNYDLSQKQQDLESQRVELETTNRQLVITKTALTRTNRMLLANNDALTRAQHTVKKQYDDLAKFNEQLTTASHNLEKTNAELVTAKTNLQRTYDELIKTNAKLTGEIADRKKAETDAKEQARIASEEKNKALAANRVVKEADDNALYVRSTLRGHAKEANAAVFSADMNYIFTAADDGKAILWDSGVLKQSDRNNSRTPQVVDEFSDPDIPRAETQSTVTAQNPTIPTTAAMSPVDSKVVALAGRDNAVLVWSSGAPAPAAAPSPQTERLVKIADRPAPASEKQPTTDNRATPVRLLGNKQKINEIAFSSDGNWIATAGEDQIVRIWNWRDCKTNNACQPVNEIVQNSGPVKSVAFSNNGTLLATSQGNTGRIWRWRDCHGACKPSAELKGHTKAVNDTVFNQDQEGSRAVTASEDGTARTWDTTTGKQKDVLRDHGGLLIRHAKRLLRFDAVHKHFPAIKSAAFSPKGGFVVTGSADQTARIWDLKSTTVVRILRGHLGSVTDVNFSSDGQFVITASDDRTVRVWAPCQSVKSDYDIKTGPSSKRFCAYCENDKTSCKKEDTHWVPR